jgi:hypothetical protein
MSRTRVATVLGVVAVLSVLATAAVAVTRNDGEESDPELLTVSADGASFEVPADGWQVEDRSVRIYLTDARDRPVAVVRGPAVFNAGYCGKGSNQAFAGITRQGIDAWVGALGEPGRVDRETVGSASITRVEVEVEAGGPCSVTEAEVAMVEVGDVRVVLVQDAGALQDEDVEQVLLSLELP